MLKILLISLTLIVCINSSNETHRMNSNHPMSIAWSLHPIFGLIGTILNGAVLYIFIKERHTFIKIINLLFW